MPGATDTDDVSSKGRGQIIIAKQRDGILKNMVIYHHDERYKKSLTDRKEVSRPPLREGVS